MNEKVMRKFLDIGENIAVEFKRCGNRIEDDVYETVCSFLNRFGGDIFLGVKDNGTVSGISPKAAPDLVKNIIKSISNPELFSPTVYIEPDIEQYEGKTVIHLHIPPSSEVHRFKKVIYDRVNDADVKVTATGQIAQMYIRKQNIFTEKKIYPYVTMDDLRLDLLPKIRQLASNTYGESHPWNVLDNEELLRSAGLYSMDRITGEKGYNLAAIMILGKDDVIRDVVPAYMTDALVRRVDTDRYDDREIVQTNLIESYERLMAFGRKHLPDKFFLEGDQRKSLRNIILRELIANTLIHREYTSIYQAKFVIESHRMYTANGNRADREAMITPDNLEPNPKNPVIAAFFRHIGYADQLGSGVRNVFKYSRFYSGESPKFIEDDVFKIIVPIAGEDDEFPEETTQSDGKTTQSDRKTIQSDEKTTQSNGKTTQSNGKTTQSLHDHVEERILQWLHQEPELSQKELAEKMELNLNRVKYYIRKLSKQGRLERQGTRRKGHWIVKSDNR